MFMSNKYNLSKKNVSFVLMAGLIIGIIVVANQMAKGTQKFEIQSDQNHNLSQLNKIKTVSDMARSSNATDVNITKPVLAAHNATDVNITKPVLAAHNIVKNTASISTKPNTKIVNLQEVAIPKGDQIPGKHSVKKPHSDKNVITPHNLNDNTKTKSTSNIKHNYKPTDPFNTDSSTKSKTTSKQKTPTFSDPHIPSESFDLPFAAIPPKNLF